MRKIIAVDFDGVLFSDGKHNQRLMDYLSDQRSKDNKVILWTSRQDDNLDFAIKLCKENGLEFDAVNDNVFKSSARKIIADIYIDDKSMNVSFDDDDIVERLENILNGEVRSMPIRENREYRSMPLMDFRQTENEEPSYVVEGYASTFEPYLMFEDGEKRYFEQIDRSAFDESDMSDVLFLYNHEGQVMARQKNGSLLLSVDDGGLKVVANLGGSARGREMAEEIRSGLVDQMSFAFTVDDDHIERNGNIITRIITRMKKLYDVSAVSVPANGGTSISCRSAWIDGEIKQAEAERLQRQADDEERAKVEEQIQRLKAYRKEVVSNNEGNDH